MPDIKKIMVTIDLAENEKQELEKMAPKYNFTYKKYRELTIDNVKDVNVILGNAPINILKHSDNLEWIQITSSGAEGYRDQGILKKGVILTSATGAYGPAVAEHAYAMMYTLMKKIHLYRDNQNKNLWKSEGMVTTVLGKTVLVLGLGDIGKYFAKMVSPLAKKVIGFNTSGKHDDSVDEVYTLDRLDDFLKEADIIMMVLPGTEKTKNVINKDRLALMKKSAIIINVGRGTAIDTNALCDAVESGVIASAGLEVTDPEPLPADHRAWKVKNILITPHVSGGFNHEITLKRVYNIVLKNLSNYLKGKQMYNVINKDTGYATNVIDSDKLSNN